ncbi:Leptin receptor gene-related protein [Lepeophtheirus salmonis]|uniref:Leptin receptor gene-related protein n=1 Tax=Lepeophtheirus salmonis TaxID=72036 RepID=D3PJF1_LEPSM|nr:LOW QUALITY PROTEIN: leptin receptor gene-related protein-like [Lepeophtheirus salmonis]ADD38687.1 Leptin receptor overlapping transcript-like 1 [Lepeophtheirus salmonis]CAB4062312.1 Leptin receptor gene-related protein [Lepeophtheirus salmonis]CAF2900565.1 Leptin receptor gene-related protein [Lepeophtheirus salmonis]
MAGIKSLIALAFAGSFGFLFLLLSCALPQFQNNWTPMFVILFYVLFPLPIMIARRHSNEPSSCKEFSFFLMTIIAISAFALPIVLARAYADQMDKSVSIISGGAAALVEFANLIVFSTIIRFLWVNDYSEW